MTPFSEGQVDLLTQDIDALVNAVNTVGVMGKGIALQFKLAWPAMFQDYQAAAKRGDLMPGRMHVWETGSTTAITSIAIPPLGCGHGGLDWSDVEPVIRSKLATIEAATQVVLFHPGAPLARAEAPDARNSAHRPAHHRTRHS